MFDKPFDSIDAADIEQLIYSGEVEKINLEYKQQVWGRGDEDTREMLRDISAMANAYGGYIVLGIRENSDTGRAESFENVPDAGLEQDRMLSSCLSNLDPRLGGIQIKPLVLDGKEILLIKIPNSQNVHQITFKNLGQFWKRHDRQKTRMSYDEIKEAIIFTSQSSKSTEDFISEHVGTLTYNQDTLFLVASPIKFSGDLFRVDNQDIRALLKKSHHRNNGWHFDMRNELVKPSLKGLRIHDALRDLELYRNGYMEGTLNIEGDYMITIRDFDEAPHVIRGQGLIESTYSFFDKYKRVMEVIGYGGPFICTAGLSRVDTLHLNGNPETEHYFQELAEPAQGTMILDNLVFESIDSLKITKEICDRIWQSYGFENEPYITGDEFPFK